MTAVAAFIGHPAENGSGSMVTVAVTGDNRGSLSVWKPLEERKLATLQLVKVCLQRHDHVGIINTPNTVYNTANQSQDITQTVSMVCIDGSVIVAGGDLGSVGVWKWAPHARSRGRITTTPLARVPHAHDGLVTAVAVAPITHPLPYAVTGGTDHMLRLWPRPFPVDDEHDSRFGDPGVGVGVGVGAGAGAGADSKVPLLRRGGAKHQPEQTTTSRRLSIRGHNAPITVVHCDTFKIVSAR